MKPITPSEVADQKLKDIPDFVIEIVNKLIASNFSGSRSCFQQEAVVAAILAAQPEGVTRQAIFNNGWLNFEEIYRQAGWTVEYDKPGYNETYAANFTFSKPREKRG